MLSIIICSISPTLQEQVKQNLKETVGIEHEFIIFDNREFKYGLCKVYNLCANKAKFDYLCFVHEDILIASKDWGQNLVEFCNVNPLVGLVGVAGYGYVSERKKSNAPPTSIFMRVNQLDKEKKDSTLNWIPLGVQSKFKVSVVDGQFLFTPKHVWKQYPFDEQNFPHFHLYDLDYSMQVNQSYLVIVTTEIDITHFSTGSFDDFQKKYYRKFIQKWQHRLPCITMPDQTTQNDLLDAVMHDIINLCLEVNFTAVIKVLKKAEPLLSHVKRLNVFVISSSISRVLLKKLLPFR